MKAQVVDQKGKKLKDITLSDEIFGIEVNDKIISQYVYSYLSNQRQANAHTKDRSEVRGGGKKPWRQKGTGRARFGSSRVPIWRGGGVTFGPTNERNFKKKLTKKFKKAALKNVLSLANKEDKLLFVGDITISDKKPLTKQAADFRGKVADSAKKITLVTAEKKDDVIKSFSNLSGAKVVFVKDMSAYDILAGGKVVIEEKALEFITNKFSK